MTASPSGVRPPIAEANQALKRRGLLAAAVACVAGLVAKLSEQPVSAGVDGDVVLGSNNVSTTTTTIVNGTADSISLEGFCRHFWLGGGW
jgi:hypothetical protein